MISHTAIRADHIGGYVSLAVVPYVPSWPIPAGSRERFQPWACTFHTDPGGPRQFIAFGGHAGMLDAVFALLGPLLIGMHGGLFEALAERVDFELDNTPLQGARLEAIAEALDLFIRSSTFEVDCYLVGADPLKARGHLETMQIVIKSGRAIVL